MHIIQELVENLPDCQKMDDDYFEKLGFTPKG